MTNVDPEFGVYVEGTPITKVDELGQRKRAWPSYEDLVTWTTTPGNEDTDYLNTPKAERALAAARTAISHATRLPLYEPDGSLCTVPENVWLGCLMYAQQLYLNLPLGAYGASETGAELPSAFDHPEIKALIGPYRVFGLA